MLKCSGLDSHSIGVKLIKGSVIMDNIDTIVVWLAVGYIVWFTWEVWNDFE